jgi:hypothetical protein
MNARIALIALLLCLTTLLLAHTISPATYAPVASVVAASAEAEAKVVLAAPNSARIGELVRLDVSESSADSFKWILVPDAVDFLVYDAGARAVFSARREGEFRFIVACAKGGEVDVVTHVVRIIGPPDEPTSDALSELIPYWNWDLDLPGEECRAMADGFESIADRADELGDTNAWLKATAAMSQDTLGDRIDAWKPMLDRIGVKLREKAEIGALSTPEEHRNAWMSIVRGLRAC